MYVLVCPGIHAPQATEDFLQGMQRGMGAQPAPAWLIFPTDRYPAYSGGHIGWFLYDQLKSVHPQDWLNQPVIIIGFSAGVAGAIAAAWGWSLLGGEILALIAVDGWGVPLSGDFPIHRLSHDHFTHWSSALLGAGQDSFYAEPPVNHLNLWRSPQTTHGWWLSSNPNTLRFITAAEFIATLLNRYTADAVMKGGLP
jgi:hypothetical protein